MKIHGRTILLASMIALGVHHGYASDGWFTDWEKAKAEATASGRDILVDFTGSDWCGWCKRLDKEVFSQEAFKTYAAKQFVLMEVDFPHEKQQSKKVKEQNQELEGRFGVRGYPSIFLTTACGLPYAKTGYQRGGPDVYIKHLEELRQVRTTYDDALTKAQAAQGLEKARQLKAALDGIPIELLHHYLGILEQIEVLDPENQTGCRTQLASMRLAALEADALSLLHSDQRKDIAAKVDAFIAKNALEGTAKQEALFVKLNAYSPMSLEDLAEAEVVLDALIALDGSTRIGKTAAQIKAQLPQMRERISSKKDAE